MRMCAPPRCILAHSVWGQADVTGSCHGLLVLHTGLHTPEKKIALDTCLDKTQKSSPLQRAQHLRSDG